MFLVEDIEFGKIVRVTTPETPYAYALELSPKEGFPEAPFVLTCIADVRGPGMAGFGALNAARDDFVHVLYLSPSPKRQKFDIVCGGPAGFAGLVVRAGEIAGSCDVTLTVLGIKPLQRQNVTIFQYGKVGSQTVEAALLQVLPPDMVERHHILSPHAVTQALSECLNVLKFSMKDHYPSFVEENGLLAQVKAARIARNKYLARQRAGTAVLMTGVRDPVDTSVASFFQQLDLFCPGLSYEPERIDADAERALQRFYDGALMAGEDASPQSVSDAALVSLFSSGIAKWFATEFREFTGVDILRSDFDDTGPFVRFQENGHDIIVYRTEQLNRAIPMIMSSLDLTHRPAHAVNVGSQKPTGMIYSKFKDRFVETDMIAHLLRTTPYAMRFYPQHALNAAALPMCAGE